MELDNRASDPIIKGDEIDLRALVKTVWAGRKAYAIIVSLFLALGLLISYTSPVLYQSNATLLPSVDKKSGTLGNIGALAGMAGINVSSLMGEASVIPAELYPQIVSSTPFLIGLMNEQVNWSNNSKMSFFERINLKKEESIWQLILKYTINLPFTIKELVSKQEPITQNAPELQGLGDYLVLTTKEDAAIRQLSNSINLDFVKSTGIVNLSIMLDDRLAVAELTAKAHILLQKYIIDYRTKHAKENVMFLESRVNEKKVLFEEAMKSYFYYRDSHRDIVAERVDVTFQRLIDAYNIESTVYKGLLQQLEQAKIILKEETPAFTVIDPVVVPLKKSKPQRAMIMLFAVFSGIIFSTMLLYVMHFNKMSRLFERYLIFRKLKHLINT